MDREQFRNALATLGLTQMDAAKLFRVNPRTVRRWALGATPLAYPVTLCLELMLMMREKDAELALALGQLAEMSDTKTPTEASHSHKEEEWVAPSLVRHG